MSLGAGLGVGVGQGVGIDFEANVLRSASIWKEIAAVAMASGGDP